MTSKQLASEYFILSSRYAAFSQTTLHLVYFLLRNTKFFLFEFFYRYRTVNYEIIDKYGQHLKSRGIEGVVVNGWTGEGMTLTVDERKRLIEEWVKIGRKYEFKVFLVLGGTTLADLYYLAEHAEKIKVDAVLIYPDYFYKKYMTEDDLVRYLKDFYTRMPTRPFFYIYRREFTKRRCKYTQATTACRLSKY